MRALQKIKIPMPAFSSLWQMQIPEKFIIGQNTHFPFSEQQKRKKLTCDLPQPVSASENAHLQLKLELINGDKTVLSFTSNEKQALVQEFNNDTNSHTNIIYSFTYGDNNFMLYFYIALCVILLLFIIMTFYLTIIRQMTVTKFYIPVALFLWD